MNVLRSTILSIALAVSGAVGVVAQNAPSVPDNTGPNAAIERVIRGEYVTRALAGGPASDVRGAQVSERFELISHPDGTRTLISWNENTVSNALLHAIARVDGGFRPLESHQEYWVDGKFKGTAFFRLDGTELQGFVRTSQGSVATQTLIHRMPGAQEPVSFATHSIAADGWRTAYVDSRRSGVQQGTLVDFDSSSDPATPIVARMQPQKWRYAGDESLEVPAGRFDSERYESGEAAIWITGPDRVLVRAVWPSLSREYVLAKLETLVPGSAERIIRAEPDRVGANPNISRWAEGEYAYRALGDGRDRGWERFRLTVHPDGSRSILMWHGLRARSAQFTVALRTEASFRPLDAYVSYWNDGKFKGSAAMRVSGGALDVVSHGAWGSFRERIDVPDRFSIGTHPIAADGWHLWVADVAGIPAQVYGLEASGDPAKPIRGVVRAMPVQTIGYERISVPAGEFDTTHYRIAGGTDIWVHGEDRLMVRMRAERSDRDYVLTRFAAGR